MKLKKRSSSQKRTVDWFRVISLAAALALATLPLTLSDTTLASFTMSKYVTNNLAGDSFNVVRQGALITVTCGNGTKGSGRWPGEGDYEQYLLPGGYWGIAASGQAGNKTDGNGGAGGIARGMIYIPGNSGYLYLDTRPARGGDGSLDAQDSCDGGFGGNAIVISTGGYVATGSNSGVVAVAGGGGGGGDGGSDHGGAGGQVSNGGRANGSNGGSTGGAATGSSSTSDGITTYTITSVLSRGGHSNTSWDHGAGGGGIPGGQSDKDAGGGGGASYCQMSLPKASGGGFAYYETLPNAGSFNQPGKNSSGSATVYLIYFGEVKPGDSVIDSSW